MIITAIASKVNITNEQYVIIKQVCGYCPKTLDASTSIKVGMIVKQKNKILLTNINLFCFLTNKSVSLVDLLSILTGEFRKLINNQSTDSNPSVAKPNTIPNILIKS
jgi:hypothetical protein